MLHLHLNSIFQFFVIDRDMSPQDISQSDSNERWTPWKADGPWSTNGIYSKDKP